MEYVQLGRTGLRVSRLCLGCWSYGNQMDWMLEIDRARPIIERAFDLGINFFDTANNYSKGRSEEILGEVLEGRRQDIIMATKVWGEMGVGPNDRGLSRLHIMRQIEDSLHRLRTNYVDLYQIHRWDYSTPIEETLSALDDLVHNGKVRYIGASSMWTWQLAKSLWVSDKLGLVRFESMQNHYNLCYREEEREMIPLCMDQMISLIPWSPLARGFLSGRYKRGENPDSIRYRSESFLKERFFRPEDFDVLESVTRVAADKGVKPTQIALAWLLHKGVTAPIIGATKLEHIEDAVDSLDIRLTTDDVKCLEEMYRPRTVIGHT
jgi:aryl-alcohol dehydrogenase-like predicted oxidoreductase